MSNLDEQHPIVLTDEALLLNKDMPDSTIKLASNKKLSNNLQSYVNSVKIFLGNVYLTIPAVFSHTGLAGGIGLYSMVAALNTYTMT